MYPLPVTLRLMAPFGKPQLALVTVVVAPGLKLDTVIVCVDVTIQPLLFTDRLRVLLPVVAHLTTMVALSGEVLFWVLALIT